MPKRSRKQIEIDNRQVLEELTKNSNQSPDKIAKKAGYSRQKVWRCIKKLEENHTIWGYHAIVDKEKIGLKNYTMLIKKTDLPAVDIAELIIKRVVDDLGEKIGVSVIGSYYVYGGYDWIVTFTAPGIREANKFCEIMRSTYKGYIEKLELLEHIFVVKKCGILNPDKKQLKEFFTVPV